MATATARRHIARALCETLRLPMNRIAGITSRFDNGWSIDDVRDDVRGCVARVVAGCWIEIVVPDGEGERFVVSLELERDELVRHDAARNERADAAPTITDAAADDDGSDGRHIDGTILAVAVAGSHLRLLVDVAGVETDVAMMSVFESPDELLDYAAPSIGRPCRLFLERTHGIHAAIGIPTGVPVADMIAPHDHLTLAA